MSRAFDQDAPFVGLVSYPTHYAEFLVPIHEEEPGQIPRETQKFAEWVRDLFADVRIESRPTAVWSLPDRLHVNGVRDEKPQVYRAIAIQDSRMSERRYRQRFAVLLIDGGQTEGVNTDHVVIAYQGQVETVQFEG